MKKKTRILTVDDLKEGMVTASKVEQDGSLFINSDVKITKTIIARLKSMYFFGYVEVYDDYEEEQAITKNDLSNTTGCTCATSKKINDSNKKTIDTTFIKKANMSEKIYDDKYKKVEIQFNEMSMN